MTRILTLCLLLTGCRSCAERRAERAYSAAREELSPALDVEPIEVVAEQVERDGGGVEAWGDEVQPVALVAPEGWTLTINEEPPGWVEKEMEGGCPDDVPLAWFFESAALDVEIAGGQAWGVEAFAGGCDADGDDIHGTYDAGYTLDVEAENDEGDVYQLTLAVPVVLTIE